MFGRLLQKILPKKKQAKELTARELSGRNNVGYPTIQLSRESDELVKKYYKGIRPAIQFYKETLFFKWGPTFIEESLSDEQLAALSGRNVQMVYLLLFRDMLRHIAPYVHPKNAHDNWVETLSQEILDNCQMLSDADDHDVETKKALFAGTEIYNIETEEPQAWIEPLVALAAFPADKLYRAHRALLTTMLKKLNKDNK
ncbi:hypothetical protein [Zophobihabitans entericus]|uniref:Uncharacterized protein n=1 Tax=Zophobihabitans entericus TaxID=1635327 RepID=A0A6G9I8V4_9GAMM|nr:hypothetical protein [Zophobihabitans entericus]QIQ20645.1 hypothetical protein IPMB12_02455 [Zophobihabitans entericus]